MSRRLLVTVLPILLFAQTLAAQGGQTPAGMQPVWEIQKTLDALIAQTRRMAPMLDEIRAKDWVAKGAPDAYIQQQQSVRNEINYLIQTTQALKARPERMADTLRVYLRLQSLESLLDSLAQGVRRYQNPALADLIQGMIVENDNNRRQLRSYLEELVANKEDELSIMNEEAQRCRGMLIRQPAQRSHAPAPKPASTSK